MKTFQGVERKPIGSLVSEHQRAGAQTHTKLHPVMASAAPAATFAAPVFEEKEIQKYVVFVGPSGVGKSTLINSLGHHAGDLNSLAAVGNELQSQTTKVSSYRIPSMGLTVFDTGGYGDTGRDGKSGEEKDLEIRRNLQNFLGTRSINAICICLPHTTNRLTPEIEALLQEIQSQFTLDALKGHVIVLQTFNSEVSEAVELLARGFFPGCRVLPVNKFNHDQGATTTLTQRALRRRELENEEFEEFVRYFLESIPDSVVSSHRMLLLNKNKQKTDLEEELKAATAERQKQNLIRNNNSDYTYTTEKTAWKWRCPNEKGTLSDTLDYEIVEYRTGYHAAPLVGRVLCAAAYFFDPSKTTYRHICKVCRHEVKDHTHEQVVTETTSHTVWSMKYAYDAACKAADAQTKFINKLNAQITTLDAEIKALEETVAKQAQQAPVAVEPGEQEEEEEEEDGETTTPGESGEGATGEA